MKHLKPLIIEKQIQRYEFEFEEKDSSGTYFYSFDNFTVVFIPVTEERAIFELVFGPSQVEKDSETLVIQDDVILNDQKMFPRLYTIAEIIEDFFRERRIELGEEYQYDPTLLVVKGVYKKGEDEQQASQRSRVYHRIFTNSLPSLYRINLRGNNIFISEKD